ncbi:MAG: glycosyl hydrolase family 28-related protein, partial [Oceanobacter sp.]
MVTINLQANIPLFLKSFRFGDFLLAFLMLVSTSANGITIAGQYIPAWRAGVSGGIPDIPTVGSVTDFGAIPNDKRDDTLAFIKAIKKLEGQGAILIPEGTFLLTAPIAMPSGTVLRGQGSDKTHIEINHSGHGFVVKGKGTGSGELENPMEYPKVVRGAFKGSYEIELDKAGKFSLGDGIELVQGYDKSLHATQPKWDQSWAKRLIGHFSRIESLTNNTIKLSD